MSVEDKAAEVLLQKPLELKVGNNVYKIAKPTLATLMEVSRYVAMLPKVEKIEQNEIITFVLSNANKYGRVLANIAAVLIVGIGKESKCRQNEKKGKIKWFWKKNKPNKIELMADEIMNSASCEEICRLISGALSYQSIGFFLSTIISLGGANISERTKNETEATAPGE